MKDGAAHSDARRYADGGHLCGPAGDGGACGLCGATTGHESDAGCSGLGAGMGIAVTVAFVFVFPSP